MVYLEYVAQNRDTGGQDLLIPRKRVDDIYSEDPTLRNLIIGIHDWYKQHACGGAKISIYSCKDTISDRHAEVYDIPIKVGENADISSIADSWLDLKVGCDFVIGFQKLEIWYVYLLEGQKFPKDKLKSPLECP